MLRARSGFLAARRAAVAALVGFGIVSAAIAADLATAPVSAIAVHGTVTDISAASAASGAAAVAAKPKVVLPPEVVARVNGQDITRVELADKLLKYYGDQGLNAIIQQAVVRQEAKALGVTATDQDLDRMENDFYSNAAAFRPGAPLEERKALWAHLLQSRGQTIETFRHDLEIEVLIEKLVDRRINITDEELQTEFKTLFKKGSPGENVKFEDVKAGLVDRLTKERAKALRPQVIAEIMKKADVERGDVILPGQ